MFGLEGIALEASSPKIVAFNFLLYGEHYILKSDSVSISSGLILIVCYIVNVYRFGVFCML